MEIVGLPGLSDGGDEVEKYLEKGEIGLGLGLGAETMMALRIRAAIFRSVWKGK